MRPNYGNIVIRECHGRRKKNKIKIGTTLLTFYKKNTCS